VPGKHVITVEHPSSIILPRAAVPELGVIMYVGSTNEYNRRGLSMFLEHAWRPILDAYPDAALHVVGQLTEDVIGSHERVVFKGIVSDTDLARCYASAHVVINPQVDGTGLKIKSVEAISAGCAIVMNAAGADGIEEGSGTAFLVASDWKEFSRYVLRILADEDFRAGLERGASRFAKERFSVEAVFRELATVLDAHEARIGSV
jgi:glycosyltransferase involved in cell wall biosynthesis